MTCARCSAEALAPERVSTWREADRIMRIVARLRKIPDVSAKDCAALTEAADLLRIAKVERNERR